MRNYYYLIISLPALELNSQPQIRFEEFFQSLEINLTESDFNSVKTLLLFYDLVNLERMLQKGSYDLRGQLSATEQLLALRFKEYYPEFVFDFFEKHQSDRDQLLHFAKIYSLFFSHYSVGKSPENAVLKFERELRLFLILYRTKKFKKDLSFELRYEDAHDPFVYQLLSQKEAIKLAPPEDFVKLAEELDSTEDPIQVNQIIEGFRFYHYQELQSEHSFTILGLLAYMMQLLILEDLEKADSTYGLEMFNYILKDNHEYTD